MATSEQGKQIVTSPFWDKAIDITVEAIYGARFANAQAFLKKYYGVDVYAGVKNDFDRPQNTVRGLQLEDAAKGLEAVAAEVGKYPPDQILTLRRIRLACSLLVPRVDDQTKMADAGGQAYNGDTMAVVWNWFGPNSAKRTTHHEMEHLEGRVRKHISPGMQKWEQFLLDQDFQYLGEPYWDLTPQELAQFTTEGFVRHYSLVSAEEDRATVCEELFMPTPEGIKKRANDPILEQKYKIMEEEFGLRSKGRMNPWFFEAIREGKVDRDYWQRVDMPHRRIFASCYAAYNILRANHRQRVLFA